MIELYKTTDNAGHIHTINNPGSGFTDPGPDGHFHGLVKGCNTCAKIRAALHVETIPTTFVQGHLHFLNSGSLVPR
jgi:hypothetical protein